MSNELEYQELDLHQHVLKRPDTYVGSVRKEKSIEFVFNNNEKRIEEKEFKVIPAVVRLFIEALSNAVDNKWRSDEQNIECKYIRIHVDKETGETSIQNDGMAIPFRDHETSNVPIPEMLFGRLLTSSNYNDEEERYTSGKNGLGVSLINIFSTNFSIELINNKQCYKQSWKNNMYEKTEPKITKVSKKNYTLVKWIPDFEYFKINGYTKDMISLFQKYAYDTAMITGLNVYFNDEKVNVKKFKDYALLYAPETKNTLSISCEKSEAVLLESTSRDFQHISFVNGIYTKDGGVHVDAYVDKVLKVLVLKINSKLKCKLNVGDIKPYFCLIVNCQVPNPEFSSQSKTRLTAPKINVTIDEKRITPLLKWDFMKKVEKLVAQKDLGALKKTEKRSGILKISGYDPANKAGKKESLLCSLLLCEGDSARSFATAGIQVGIDFGGLGFLKGRDYIGALSLRGKGLNTRNASTKSITENREITNIIQILGLQFGVDYTKDENFRKLNYGRVVILSDQDLDGFHIKSLIFNMFDTLFPTLLQRNDFLIAMETPIVKTGNKVFYDLSQAREYIQRYKPKQDSIEYYKGLGTLTSKDAKDVFGKRMIEYDLDEKAQETLNMVFHKDFADQRKKWLLSYRGEKCDYKQNGELTNFYSSTISDFINYEMIKFSIDDCARNLPNVMDGLKQSQRKAIFCAFLKNLTKPLKVAQFAGLVAQKTSYHHGEMCLYDTITRMAQDFVGSNNIPYFYQGGQFGTRVCNGKDAANARYIKTNLLPITFKIFKKEDEQILNYLEDDGMTIEPDYYLPIIPMVLVNGVGTALGTGFSCNVPNHNPKEIIEWYKHWIDNPDHSQELLPFYNGFKGEIVKISSTKFETRGVMHRDGRKVHVTELPINMSMDKFKEHVESLIEKKKVKDMINHSTTTKVDFQVIEHRDQQFCTLDTLNLTSSLHISNMVLFDCDNNIKKFKTVHELLVYFGEKRLEYYEKRREKCLKTLRQDLLIASSKYRFIKSVMDGQIVLNNREDDEVEKILEEEKFETIDDKYDYLLGMPVKSFTKKRLESLEKSMNDLREKLRLYELTNAKDIWLSELNELEKSL